MLHGRSADDVRAISATQSLQRPTSGLQTPPSCRSSINVFIGLVQAEDVKEMLSKGYQLLDLDGHEIVEEQQHDTRALLGWGAQGILLSFRGTASLQNAISDLRV